MEQNIDNKSDFKERIYSFYKKNKLKIYLLISVFIIVSVSLFSIKINEEKRNKLIAEKYIQAGLYLTSDKKEQAKSLHEEIILSKNKFYSILSLNTILEKELVTDKNKILDFFDIIEKINITQNQRDLIIFKKALFLIKTGSIQEGKKILNVLIEQESELKFLAAEVISN
jgi:hypothetical protein